MRGCPAQLPPTCLRLEKSRDRLRGERLRGDFSPTSTQPSGPFILYVIPSLGPHTQSATRPTPDPSLEHGRPRLGKGPTTSFLCCCHLGPFPLWGTQRGEFRKEALLQRCATLGRSLRTRPVFPHQSRGRNPPLQGSKGAHPTPEPTGTAGADGGRGERAQPAQPMGVADLFCTRG